MSDPFKDARHKAMTEGFARVYGTGGAKRNPKNAPISGPALSMGCLIPAPECSLCSTGDTHHLHFAPLMAREGVPFEPFTLQSFSVSMVAAPKCEVCHVEMSGHDHTSWECRTEGCAALHKPVSAHLSGIYPARLLPGGASSPK